MIPTYSQLVAARTDAPKSFTFHMSESASFTVRTLLRDGEPWFVAADVCAALYIQNATQAVARLDDEDRAMLNIAPQGETNAVNESGLYSLILGSRKPEAKPFKRWVTSEVLPEIRKTGGYARNTTVALPNFADPVAAARAWADATESKLKAETALALAAPKVEFVDRYVTADTGAKGFRQVCKLLKANEARFREFLAEEKIMYRLSGELVAYQNHIDAGRFECKTGEANGHAFSRCLFTPKGVEWVAGEWAKRQVRDTDLFA
jgi:prophage antirepressor-like protein